MQKVSLKINGKQYEFDVEPDMVLLDLLREDLHLTGAKQSCDRKEQCGACTVIVNKKATRSCLTKVVNLQGADGKALQVAEARIAGPEIVNSDSDPHLPQVLEPTSRPFTARRRRCA